MTYVGWIDLSIDGAVTMDMFVDVLVGQSACNDAIVVYANKAKRGGILLGMHRCTSLASLVESGIGLVNNVLFVDLSREQTSNMFHFAARHRKDRMRRGLNIDTTRPIFHGPLGLSTCWNQQVEMADYKEYPRFREYGTGDVAPPYQVLDDFRILAVLMSDGKTLGYRIESITSSQALVFLAGVVKRRWALRMKAAAKRALLRMPVGALLLDVRSACIRPADIPWMANGLEVREVLCFNASEKFQDKCAGLNTEYLKIRFPSIEKRLQAQLV